MWPSPGSVATTVAERLLLEVDRAHAGPDLRECPCGRLADALRGPGDDDAATLEPPALSAAVHDLTLLRSADPPSAHVALTATIADAPWVRRW